MSRRELGRIIRLQVQQASLKTGPKPHQTYSPFPHLTSVQALRLNADGVVGIDERGTMLPDVHNATHPASKFRGENGISIGFTSHYAAIRERFGDHLTDGIAGESMLVECAEPVSLEMIGKGIVIMSDHGAVEIGPWVVMHPCAPFSKFCLRMSGETKPDRRVTETLQFLDNGMRGFSAVYPADAGVAEIRVGDRVLLMDS